MNHPPVGARLTSTTCHFNVWAPLRKKVELILEETNASLPMERDGMGYWSVEVRDIKPGALYRYRLDGDTTLPDPASRAQPQGVHGPSAVTEIEYDWTDDDWNGLPLGEMIIYELHVGTFTSGNDFNGVIAKLPYLKTLGVNTIELLPVAQFPGKRNWGYDGVYPYAVQDSYGGVHGLKKLVDSAHREGIAVILDVVYNHQGPEGNYLSQYGPYFTDKYKTGWGQAINFDDAWCDGVRNFYWRNALTWLDEFHVDGLRIDAVHAIWDFSANHFIEGLSEQVKELQRRSGREKVLVAEFDLNNPRYILPIASGGYGLDGQWVDEFHHALHSLITGETSGYYEDFGQMEHLARAMKDSYVYTGQYSPHRKKHFGRVPRGTKFDQFVVFIQNHDQTGNRMLGDRLTSLVSREALKLAAAAYILSPHVPMLFMGEEYGEKNPFQYFISHTDEALVELVRKGRKEEFSYFKWQGEVPDPQSEQTFQNCVLSWAVETDNDAQNLFAYYQQLLKIRKLYPALRARERDTIKIVSSDDKVLCVERKGTDSDLIMIMNFNERITPYSLSRPRFKKKILDSASQQWNGPGEHELHSSNPTLPLELQPQSVLIFET